MLHRVSEEYNVKAQVRVDGRVVNAARDCEGCGDFWRVDDQGAGARYFHGGRWLCVDCRCK